MSIRARFLGFVDVIMRIPPLFLLDELLKLNVFFENSRQFENLENSDLNETLSSLSSQNQTDAFESSIDFYGISILFFKFLLFLFGEYNKLN